MSTSEPLSVLLADLEAQKIWEPHSPMSEEQIEAADAMLPRPMPRYYRDFLSLCDGGYLRGEATSLTIFGTTLLPDHNERDYWTAELNPMFVFASDQGSHIYYIDVDDVIGRGAGAIYCVDMAVGDLEYSIYAAQGLIPLFERVARGENPTNAPYLGRQA